MSFSHGSGGFLWTETGTDFGSYFEDSVPVPVTGFSLFSIVVLVCIVVTAVFVVFTVKECLVVKVAGSYLHFDFISVHDEFL